MNLVQINERLKDLPEQVIRQYANGMNPEVPPYLALGELQRRELSAKQMASTQGGAQGPQPSVKEQIEQKAGLMGLQQMQQQQMAQQQRPRGPMPAPAGVPQPQAQPQAPMMARGGLASIPVRSDMFEYARGGIIAFANGGDTMGMPSLEQQELTSQAASITDEMLAKQKNKARVIAELEQKLAFLTEAGAPQAAEVRAQLEAIKGPEAPKPAAPIDPSFRRQPDPRTTGTSATPPARPPITSNAAPRVDVGQKAPAAQAPAQQSGLPGALPARSPYFAQVNADLAKPIAAPTPAGVIAEQKALSPEAMQEDFMKKRMQEQRQRAAGERAAFEKTRPSGLDDLIRVFGQAGQYKGMSGMGPAYTANQQQKRAEELAMERRQNELMTAVDTREYEGGKELFGARSKAMDTANKAFQERLKSRSEVLAQMAGVDQRAIDSALDRLNATQIAQLRSAAEARPSEAERIEATYTGLLAQKKPKEAEEYLERMSRIKRGGDKAEPLEAAMAKQYAESYAAALALPAGKLRDERMAGLREMEKKLKGGGGGATGGSATPLPANASPANLTVGTVYQTAKGPAKWTGTGFSPV
jgi:hypothetical protein